MSFLGIHLFFPSVTTNKRFEDHAVSSSCDYVRTISLKLFIWKKIRFYFSVEFFEAFLLLFLYSKVQENNEKDNLSKWNCLAEKSDLSDTFFFNHSKEFSATTTILSDYIQNCDRGRHPQ